jgi:hypothetical protein
MKNLTTNLIQFFRLELYEEEFFDNDRYNSVLSAFKDIPNRILELQEEGFEFNKNHTFRISYEIQNNLGDVVELKTVMQIKAKKLLLNLS